MMNLQRQIAEEATGMREHPDGLGTIYDNRGMALTPEQAKGLLKAGREIEIPNAGAGSYWDVFCTLLGFKDLKVVNNTGSSGDWAFAVYDGDFWWPVYQSNRCPRFGFAYSMDRFSQPYLAQQAIDAAGGGC